MKKFLISIMACLMLLMSSCAIQSRAANDHTYSNITVVGLDGQRTYYNNVYVLDYESDDVLSSITFVDQYGNQYKVYGKNILIQNVVYQNRSVYTYHYPYYYRYGWYYRPGYGYGYHRPHHKPTPPAVHRPHHRPAPAHKPSHNPGVKPGNSRPSQPAARPSQPTHKPSGNTRPSQPAYRGGGRPSQPASRSSRPTQSHSSSSSRGRR